MNEILLAAFFIAIIVYLFFRKKQYKANLESQFVFDDLAGSENNTEATESLDPPDPRGKVWPSLDKA